MRTASRSVSSFTRLRTARAWAVRSEALAAAMSVIEMATAHATSAGWRARVRLSRSRKDLPAGTVHLGVGILRSVAAWRCRSPARRFLREPPVAHAGAADRRPHQPCPISGGRAEVRRPAFSSSAVVLPAPGGSRMMAYSGLLVEVATGAARLLQQAERLGELVAHRGDLLGGGLGGLGGGGGGGTGGECGVGLGAAVVRASRN